MTYLHTQEILHRDIKPANLFRLTSGQVVLLDFGAARGYLADQTQTMTFIGTRGFAPPEQSEKRARRGPFTDVYALAATLYYLLTGEPPMNSVIRLQEDTQPAPHELVPAIPIWLSEAVMRGLAPASAQRMQTFTAFCTLLSTPDANSSNSTQPAANSASSSAPTVLNQPETLTSPAVLASLPSALKEGPTSAQLARLLTSTRTILKPHPYLQAVALSQLAVALYAFNPQEADAIFQEAARSIQEVSTDTDDTYRTSIKIKEKATILSTIAALWNRVNPRAAERIFQYALGLAESIYIPTGVWKFLGRLGGNQSTTYHKVLLLSSIATAWSERTPERASEILDQVSNLSKHFKEDSDKYIALRQIALAWSRPNLSEALRIAGTIPELPQQLSTLREILNVWIEPDPQQALRVAHAFPTSHRAGAQVHVALALAKTDLQAALRVADQIPAELDHAYTKLYLLTRIAMLQPKSASLKASAILQQALDLTRAHPIPPNDKSSLGARTKNLADLAEVWAPLSPERAQELFQESFHTALSVKHASLRIRSLCAVADAWHSTDARQAISALQQALQVVDDSSEEIDDFSLLDIVRVWAKIDPEKARNIADRIQSAGWTAPALSALAIAWSKRDRAEANRTFAQAVQSANTVQGTLKTVAFWDERTAWEQRLQTAAPIMATWRTRELAAIALSWFETDLDALLDYVLRQPADISQVMVLRMTDMLIAPPEDRMPDYARWHAVTYFR